jgi:pimeloyl-ACP methyl ester carboxylesterase/DNA-binding XRE family transcriptional regulator
VEARATPGPFSVLLRQSRVAAGLSQEGLAERAGLSVRGISDLERGVRRAPHPATLRRLVEALDLGPTERAALLAAAQPAADPAPVEARETRYARSGDINIAYQVVGHGPIDLVFVMGWVSHLDYFWQEPGFARFLRRLASFARVILFDKRGTGLSDRSVGLPTLEQRMDDVRAVLDAVGSERAALVGISEGGALCVMFAATYPHRTAALALVNAFPRRLWAADYPWGSTLADRERRMEEVERGWGNSEWASRDLALRAPSAANDVQFAQWWATYLRMSASPGAALAVVRMNLHIDVRPLLPTIHVPSLVIHRTGDRLVSVEAGRLMAAQIPGARYVELPGEDHLPFVGDQDTLLDALEEFLTGRRPAVESDRVLATVLAMEVVHPASDSEGASASVVRDQLERYRGRAAGTLDNGLLATFDGPARGIRCALAIIDGSRPLGIELRGALHTGECDLVEGGLGGVPFRIAASAMAEAEPGQVLVSRTVRDLVAGSGIQFDERPHRPAPEGPGLGLGPWQLVRPC